MLNVSNIFILMKLSQVKIGSKVKIKSFEKHEITLKLMEMGCLPEEDVTVWKKAPLGGPIYVLVSGYSLSLRIDEADQIIVYDTLES